jgi:Zn finger protein HypA/HybF involved in hydrogenase expression
MNNDEVQVLINRIKQLESYLEKTADDKLVIECKELFCPKCSLKVEQETWLCYCWNCVNPDNFNEIPLPLLYNSCFSVPIK